MAIRVSALLLALAALSLASPSPAAVRVFACEPEWAALAREIGGEGVEVFAATTAFQDPHRIEARPSLIAQMRRADLAICSGAGLEAGWMPLLIRSAGNRAVRPGSPGYLEAAMVVERLQIPERVDRALGDIHPRGNPHVHLDPRRIASVAEVLLRRLVEIDPVSAAEHRRRGEAFLERWRAAIRRWEQAGAPLRGLRAVEDHGAWAYLFDWLGIESAGTLEPKPGVSPTVGHLAELKAALQREPADLLIRAPYTDPRPARWLHEQTGLPVAELPYTVGGSPGAGDLFGLFDSTLARLLEAAGRG